MHRTGKLFGLSLADGSLLLQIALVSHQSDDHTGRVHVLLELADPLGHVVERTRIGDVVHNEGAECVAIVEVGGRSVALLTLLLLYIIVFVNYLAPTPPKTTNQLTSCVPYGYLDAFVVDHNETARRKRCDE